jgi:ferric-dicitrate binding protein FerR (iron transport regulator)
MRQQEFRKILEKYRKGLCTPEEQALVEKWFKAMESWEDPLLDESARTEIRNTSWIRIYDHIHESERKASEQPGKERSLRIFPRHAWALAACMTFVALSVVLILRGPQMNADQPGDIHAQKRTISNDTKEEMEVSLEDGSRVLLKPESKLIISQSFANARRVVWLEGEAFFDVSRDTLHPFSVHTSEVVTKVLGTSFTVSAFADDENITVSVMTGKVSVITKQDENPASASLHETVLSPNQKVIYNRRHQVVSRSLVEEPLPILPAEVVQHLHFEAAPIKEIFAALEEVYGVDITFDETTFSACILTTSIGEGNIYSRLDMICKAIDARYVLRENQIFISGPGCDGK